MSNDRTREAAPPVERPVAGGFLAGFLAAREQVAAPGHPPGHTPGHSHRTEERQPQTGEELQAAVIAVLRQIYDPEIPVNIYDLGLIYEVEIRADRSVDLVMTLTSPHCPVAEIMPGEVEMKVNAVPGVEGVNLQLVWDPPWDMSRMSDEARLELGLL